MLVRVTVDDGVAVMLIELVGDGVTVADGNTLCELVPLAEVVEVTDAVAVRVSVTPV